MYYIAYGSNLDLKLMEERCPGAKRLGSTLLNGYTLVFKGDQEENGYLTLEEDHYGSVPVGIFEVDEVDIRRLDHYEGYPILYSKRRIAIDFQGKSVRALVYIMNPGFDYHLPAMSYFRCCLQGYHDFGFDNQYLVNALNRTEELKKGKATRNRIINHKKNNT